MSTLDQAFIKAYTKGTGPRRRASEPAPAPDQRRTDTAIHRLDGSHPGPAMPPLTAYAAPFAAGPVPAPPPPLPMVDADFGTRLDPPAAYYAAPVFVAAPAAAPAPAPIAVAPPAENAAQVSTGVPFTDAATVAAVAASAAVAAAAAAARSVPAPPSPEEAKQTLLSAAALKLPPSLDLPEVFPAPAAAEPKTQKAPRPFAPDWEVDRFTWPALCDRLLSHQGKYFRHVGQRLKQATEEQHHLVLVTGPRRGEGRTTLAMCLARSAAQAGVKVALVDADRKNPQMAARLNVDVSCGWSQAAGDTTPLNEAAVSSVEDGLTLFPLNETPDADDDKLRDVLRQIAQHFALVIVDGGPLSTACRQMFADKESSLVSAAIVVRDLRYTTEKKALAAAEELRQSGIPAVGIAENFSAA